MKFLINFVGVWVYARSIISPEVFVYTGAVIQWGVVMDKRGKEGLFVGDYLQNSIRCYSKNP